MLTLTPTKFDEKLMGVLVDQPFQLECRLFKNAVAPVQETVLADLQEADQEDYSSQNGNGHIETNVDGRVLLRWDNIEFDAPRQPLPYTDHPELPNNMVGVFFVSRYGNEDVLVIAAAFPEVLLLNTPGEQFNVELVWFPNTGICQIFFFN